MDDIVRYFFEGSDDAVIVIEMSLRGEHVRRQPLCTPVLLDGAVALKGKPPPQGEAHHGSFHGIAIPERDILFNLILNGQTHDFLFPSEKP
jgi:hypothetical protein